MGSGPSNPLRMTRTSPLNIVHEMEMAARRRISDDAGTFLILEALFAMQY